MATRQELIAQEGRRARGGTLGEVKPESLEQRRRRRLRDREAAVRERAQFYLENDPDISTMREAMTKAREDLAFERKVESGTVPDQDLKPESRRVRRRRSTSGGQPRSRPAASRSRSKSPRPAARRIERFAHRSIRSVAAPYGSVASAAWTVFMGGLSLVVFYMLLSREGSGFVVATMNGISSGFRRFSNPWIPLFPSATETAPPPPRSTVVAPRRSRSNRTTRRAVGHDGGRTARKP